MKTRSIITVLLTAAALTAAAQETHYHRALRGQDSQYGLTSGNNMATSGMTSHSRSSVPTRMPASRSASPPARATTSA